MKKDYETPLLNLIRIMECDIVRTSPTFEDKNEDPWITDGYIFKED